MSWSESAALHINSSDRDEFFSDIFNTIMKLFTSMGIGMLACMPFAFFLPRLFRKENKIKTFLITMFIIVSIIEITQFITLSGTFDIDDYILNISGAYLMFNILKMKKINLLIDKIFKKNS